MHKKLTNLILTFGFAFCLLTLTTGGLYAEEGNPTSAWLIGKAWEAHGKKDIEATWRYTEECINLYKEEAARQQAALGALPKNKDEIQKVQALNDVATAYFIQAESLMRQGKPEEAKTIFQLVIDKYPYAQAWDQFGWFWQIAEASQKSIKKMETGSTELEEKKKDFAPATTITLFDPGKEDFVDYKKYGEFQNAGTKDYQYLIKDQRGLSQAVGEGIYPNTSSLKADPAYKKALENKRFGFARPDEEWDMVHSPDLEAAFFKWATAPQPQGVKLFYQGLILEKAGLIKHALKCYYAIVVHFPSSYGITYFKTPWYVGQAAISKINFLLRRHPEFGYKLVDADIRIVNGFDNDIANDIVITNPGKLVKIDPSQRPVKPDPSSFKIKQSRGEGRVRLVQYENQGWQLLVDEKPYALRGITYSPTKVGQSPHEGTLGDWMIEDSNANGKIDGPFDSFVDKNQNNLQDSDEPAAGDFKLMQEMGVNTLRIYHYPNKVNKELLRELYKNYGISVIMGDYLGVYAQGSGASWNPGTDYNNPEHKKNMLESVTNMVLEFKDEPYILFWLLGNENVYGVACNAKSGPDAFFKFVDEAALLIKALDPNHPVAICNGDVLYLDKFGRNAPNVDIFGANAYRGDYGFGFLWKQVKDEANRPAFITEFGCSAYYEGKGQQDGEYAQAQYHRGCWEDIENNMAFGDGSGNALGGVIFEWLDEWWKGYEPSIHDKKGLWIGPFPDGTMHEEWLGLCGQGDGKS
ncbi:MAG: glycoside hydrolase family 2 TIM barrel-domain containing protein, partial [Candidatus Omnitrophota bacterium]